MADAKYPDPGALDELLEQRDDERLLPKDLWRDLKRWIKAEALLKDQGGDRTKIITLFLIYFAHPQDEGYRFLKGYIDKRIEYIQSETMLRELEVDVADLDHRLFIQFDQSCLTDNPA